MRTSDAQEHVPLAFKGCIINLDFLGEEMKSMDEAPEAS